MVSQLVTNTENNFTKGLITEATGLNFPENAATAADNCTFTLIGDVTRREGIDYEVGFGQLGGNRAEQAMNSYKWNNVGGDGLTQIVVTQVGNALYFYRSSNCDVSFPISSQRLSSTVLIGNFTAAGGVFDSTVECQFSDGNGYLFVYHPDCDPFYCAYNPATLVITANVITLQIRDFVGIPETIAVNYRPTSLSPEHLYNLVNQGWSTGAVWTTSSTTSVTPALGSITWTVAASLSVTTGDNVSVSTNVTIVTPTSAGGTLTIPGGTVLMTGSLTSYSGTSLTLNVYSLSSYLSDPDVVNWITTFYISNGGSWIFNPQNIGFISQWFSAVSNYPSNADVWWYFKNAAGAFAPASTYTNVNLNSGQAPQGHFLLSAFNQNRSLVAGINGLTSVKTTARPKTGAWFQGRVWYAGVDSAQVATGDEPYYTWTENLYFSQIVTGPQDFGSCYQTNDPTSETLFDLLPTDGGVISIQGCGSVYKLFPIANGMLVFASNGVWFITGSQGIGFSANDYTITKISSVQSISGTSFVNVMGLPYFWNEEGIYEVTVAQQGSLTVNPITVGTILTFYNSIPRTSKTYVHGDYDPIGYVIQWVYRSTQETDVTSRYSYDSIMNYNTYNKAFYPYSVDNSVNALNGIIYVNYPGFNTGGVPSPEPSLKYIASDTSFISFADEHDTTFNDWTSQSPLNYVSTFTTGYKLHGQAQKRFQVGYLYVYSRATSNISYYVQALWDYAISGNSGRWSVAQLINNWNPNFGMVFRRHRIRGRGLAVQFNFTSLDGQPFDFMGWSTFENVNAGV